MEAKLGVYHYAFYVSGIFFAFLSLYNYKKH